MLDKIFGGIEFVNADSIAAALGSPGNEIEAGKQMRQRLEELSQRGDSFAFETTLSGRAYAKFLARLQHLGYTVQIVFLWLPDVELSVQRVAERVRKGGHNIPHATIRRRFSRGIKNFFLLYQPLADVWRVYDASGDEPTVVAFGDKIDGDIIVDEALWQSIMD